MRQQLYYILAIEQREQIPKDIWNTYNFYDTVVVGSSSKGWDAGYDFLPHSNKVVKSLNRTQLVVVKKVKRRNYYNDDDEEEENTSANTIKKKETAPTKSSDDTIASATSFTFEYLQ
eukprot:6972769-Ditylum_brightwellii.AAC.1